MLIFSRLRAVFESAARAHSRPLKSRRDYLVLSTLVFLWSYSASRNLLTPGLSRAEIRSNVIFLILWAALLILIVRRRSLYVGISTRWTLPIAVASFAPTALLLIFNAVPLWLLPLFYFPAQLPLLMGKTEEPPRNVFPFPRVQYTLMVLVVIDLPLGYYMRTPAQFWVFASVCGGFMVYLTSARLRDIGFPRWSALPYTLIALSPFLQFYLHPTVSRWYLVLGSILLQTPAMLLRKGWRGQPAPSQVL